MNRISSVAFYNKKGEESNYVEVPDLSDDTDENLEELFEVEEEEVSEESEHEVKLPSYQISNETCVKLQEHYTNLHFTWTHDDSKIIIAWT